MAPGSLSLDECGGAVVVNGGCGGRGRSGEEVCLGWCCERVDALIGL